VEPPADTDPDTGETLSQFPPAAATVKLMVPAPVLATVIVWELGFVPTDVLKLSAEGETDRTGVEGSGVMVSDPEAPWESDPEFPVTVKEVVPAAAPEVVVRVNVALDGGVMEAGEKLPLTPLGRPLTESEIAELKPFRAEGLTVKVVEFPATTEADPGDSASEKSAALVTVTVDDPPDRVTALPL